MEAEWNVLNPTAAYETIHYSRAVRLNALDHKRIGLFWNGKPAGDKLLKAVGELLQEQYPSSKIIRFDRIQAIKEEQAKQIAESADAMICGVGDCGSCTSWLIRDTINLERHGTPVVDIVTKVFAKEAKWIAQAQGIGSLGIIEIPHPLSIASDQEIRDRAREIIHEVINHLTSPVDLQKEVRSTILVKPEPETLSIKGHSNAEALEEVNNLFHKNNWTDGLPIMPPTLEAVEQMLRGSRRDPGEVIGLVPPRRGQASLKNIAINALMAGAEPAYLPVIIAAVEALLDPLFASSDGTYWGAAGMLSTTSTAAPLLVINGPIAKRLGIASDNGCLGRGHRANATIGRALGLIFTNIGGAQKGINDMKCQGSAQEFTFCVAEKEDHPVFHRGEKSWQPLNIEKGYSPESNTVTASVAWPPVSVDSNESGPGILDAVADTMTSLGQIPYGMGWEYVLILGSSHAQCLADAGFSKNDIREYLFANTQMPWRDYKRQGAHKLPSWMTHIDNDATPVHIYGSAENVNIVVAGGECPYSQIVRVHWKSITKPIVE